MKRLGLLFLSLLVTVLPLSASRMTVMADLMSLDSFLGKGCRISGEVGYRRGQVAFTVPFGYAFSLSEELSLADVSLCLRLYPFSDLELYFAADIFSYIRTFGKDSPERRDLFLSSFSCGYSFEYGHLSVEPELVFLDPAGLLEGQLQFLSERFYNYLEIYFALKIGVGFDL